ncbi:hypothetical protein [Arthrobacter sp. NPDC093139]|uniref:hypothetical protein n=1 Tax=Arthrobacter sp. NPDC093139 TaxID=3363945 RepID=UPI0038124EAC
MIENRTVGSSSPKANALRAAKGMSENIQSSAPADTPVVTHVRQSKVMRRRRRMMALLLTLSVFVTAVFVGAQFLKPLLGGTPKVVDTSGFLITTFVGFAVTTLLIGAFSLFWTKTKRKSNQDSSAAWAAKLTEDVWDEEMTGNAGPAGAKREGL